ncbi:MAG: hypothetical protein HQK53_19580 [Oligoflexia bacterium]|nr:hypothetical protein [Oligoflexia bacterium]
MVIVETFFKINDKFIKANEYLDPLPDDDAHIDGAITLIVNDKTVLTFQHWDYVVLMWGFIIDGLSKNNLKEETVIGFPDQPSDLKFVPTLNNRVIIHLNGTNITSVDRCELLQALVNEARFFFNKLISLKPEKSEKFNKDLNIIDHIKI